MTRAELTAWADGVLDLAPNDNAANIARDIIALIRELTETERQRDVYRGSSDLRFEAEAKLTDAERELRSMRTDCVAGAIYRILEKERDHLRECVAAAEAREKACEEQLKMLATTMDRAAGLWQERADADTVQHGTRLMGSMLDAVVAVYAWSGKLRAALAARKETPR